MGKLSFPFFFGRAKSNYSISIICYRCLYPSIIALETASYWKRNTVMFLESRPKLHCFFVSLGFAMLKSCFKRIWDSRFSASLMYDIPETPQIVWWLSKVWRNSSISSIP